MIAIAKWWRTALLSYLFLAGCGGSGTSAPPPPLPPPPPPPVTDIWVDVKAAIDASVITNIRLVVGRASGEVFSYEKGSLPADERHRLASASKLLSGITIARLIEEGTMSLSDRPADIIPGWTQDPADDRSQITLEHLLSFTSGFNYRPLEPSCVSNGNITMGECALQFHDDGLDSVPGEVYYYGAAHLQVAGHMAELATGMAYTEIFQTRIVDALNLSTNTVFERPSTSNPRASAGAESTAADYSKILRALLAGELVADMDIFTRDRTDNVVFGHRPASLEGAGIDWHYGLGFWRECNMSMWVQACIDDIVISSGGAFGWTPWIDFTNNYYGLIAMEAPAGQNHQAPQLERQLQPLIEAALARL